MKKNNLGIKGFLSAFRDVKLPWVLLILALVGSIINYIFTLNLASLTVDVVNAFGDVETAKLMGYVVVAIAVVFGTVASNLFCGFAAEKINLSLRIKLWKKLISLPRSSYDKDKGEGLVSRITTDCTYASTLFTIMVELVSAAVGICIYYVELFSVNVEISALSVLILPLSILIAWGYGKLRYAVSLKNQEQLSQTTSYLIERIYNTPLIRAANMQDSESKAGVERFNTLCKVEIQQGLLNSLNTFINSAMPLVTMVVVFLAGAKFVNNGTMTAGGVYAFYLVASQSAVLFANTVECFGSIRGSFGAMERVVQTLGEEGEDIEAGDEAPSDASLAFDNVKFGYGDKLILDGLHLTIPKNKLTVIVGTNGSGKSTLFRLTERYYKINNGSITLNGQKAEKFSLSSWRRKIGLMPQDGVLMAGTIRSNLSMGVSDFLSDEAIDPVIEKLGMRGFIDSLPNGYDTVVEAGGKNFSGGQKQLIGMARALLYDSDILFLDEATSNLDGHSESQVKAALKAIKENRTIVMIAHDLRIILDADHAIILRDGKAVYSGSQDKVAEEVVNHRRVIMNEINT